MPPSVEINSIAISPIEVSPHVCPLCGQANGCLMAKNCQGTGENCWCSHVIVASHLIDLVANPLKNKVCICQSCIDAHQPSSF